MSDKEIQLFAEKKALEAKIEDYERWLSEVLNDFKIPYDNHKIGKRLALTQWMADKIS